MFDFIKKVLDDRRLNKIQKRIHQNQYPTEAARDMQFVLDQMYEMRENVSQKYYASVIRLRWACGHTGPAVCAECAAKARQEGKNECK